jgi:hypothetical protein
MSEFKFACPVCGQHMMCDSSQGGSVMECPTCFQKITAPRAPAPDAKFILTGTKVSEKKISTRGFDQPGAASAEEKQFPIALLISAVIVLVIVGAMLFAFRGKIFKPGGRQALARAEVVTSAQPARSPEKPAPVAPPASDTNWILTLADAVIPEATVAGRIHGQNFITERAAFQNGVLTLRSGTKGPLEFGMQINFSGAPAESLAGQTINVSTNADKAAHVQLRWKSPAGEVQKDNYDAGYALRVEFGALANNHLPGKIYLCLPDAEKSYLMGTFNADARKPKPKQPKK